MKKIILFWYILLYCIYKWDYNFQKVVNYYLAVFLRMIRFEKLVGKERYNKGMEYLLNYKKNQNEELHIGKAKIIMGGALSNLLTCLILLICAILKIDFSEFNIEKNIIYVIVVCTLFIAIPAKVDTVLFDDYKYLKSFKSFDKQTEAKKKRYKLMTIAFFFFSLLLIIFCFGVYVRVMF